MELFFDLYGNSLITEKHGQILDALIPQLKKYNALRDKYKNKNKIIWNLYIHYLYTYINSYLFYFYIFFFD